MEGASDSMGDARRLGQGRADAPVLSLRLDALREVGGMAATDALRAWQSIKECQDVPL